MRVLVAGGAGYIGSVVAERLVAEGHEVVVYDDLSRGHRQAVPQGAELVRGDVGDPAGVAAALRRRPCEAAMHFAALIEAGESMERPLAYFRHNVGATLALCQALVDSGVRTLVFSSTAAVYAPSPRPLTEDSPTGPENVYGESKLLAERALGWVARLGGLRLGVLRYFNAGGATASRGEDHRPETHLIPRVLAVASGRREQAEIYGVDYPTGDGTCVRDYVHVADLADAHLLALAALSERPALTYNVGTGTGYTVREVLEACRRVTGHPIPAVERPRRPGDPPFLVASAAALGAELGWRPRHGLEEIVRSAWEWRRRNPEGYG